LKERENQIDKLNSLLDKEYLLIDKLQESRKSTNKTKVSIPDLKNKQKYLSNLSDQGWPDYDTILQNLITKKNFYYSLLNIICSIKNYSCKFILNRHLQSQELNITKALINYDLDLNNDDEYLISSRLKSSKGITLESINRNEEIKVGSSFHCGITVCEKNSSSSSPISELVHDDNFSGVPLLTRETACYEMILKLLNENYINKNDVLKAVDIRNENLRLNYDRYLSLIYQGIPRYDKNFFKVEIRFQEVCSASTRKKAETPKRARAPNRAPAECPPKKPKQKPPSNYLYGKSSWKPKNPQNTWSNKPITNFNAGSKSWGFQSSSKSSFLSINGEENGFMKFEYNFDKKINEADNESNFKFGAVKMDFSK